MNTKQPAIMVGVPVLEKTSNFIIMKFDVPIRRDSFFYSPIKSNTNLTSFNHDMVNRVSLKKIGKWGKDYNKNRVRIDFNVVEEIEFSYRFDHPYYNPSEASHELASEDYCYLQYGHLHIMPTIEILDKDSIYLLSLDEGFSTYAGTLGKQQRWEFSAFSIDTIPLDYSEEQLDPLSIVKFSFDQALDPDSVNDDSIRVNFVGIRGLNDRSDTFQKVSKTDTTNSTTTTNDVTYSDPVYSNSGSSSSYYSSSFQFSKSHMNEKENASGSSTTVQTEFRPKYWEQHKRIRGDVSYSIIKHKNDFRKWEEFDLTFEPRYGLDSDAIYHIHLSDQIRTKDGIYLNQSILIHYAPVFRLMTEQVLRQIHFEIHNYAKETMSYYAGDGDSQMARLQRAMTVTGLIASKDLKKVINEMRHPTPLPGDKNGTVK